MFFLIKSYVDHDETFFVYILISRFWLSFKNDLVKFKIVFFVCYKLVLTLFVVMMF